LVFHLVLFAVWHFVPLLWPASPEHVMSATLIYESDEATVLPAPLAPRVPTPKPATMLRREPRVATLFARTPREGAPIISTQPKHPSATPGPVVRQRPSGPVGAGTAPRRAAAAEVVTGSNPDEYPARHIAPDGTGSGGAGTEAEGGGSGDGGESYPGSKVSVGTSFYPKDAMNDGREGTVVVSVSYDADGHVTSAAVSSSSGYADIDAAAVRGAKKSKYRPGKTHGAVIGSSDTITYHFSHGKVTVD
jgi:protein TonB